MSKKKRTAAKNKLYYSDLKRISPLTARQEDAIALFEDGQNLVLSGSAGTGKTFLAVSLALEEALKPTEYEEKQVVIIRSAVPTREIGFLPGNQKEKMDIYFKPYRDIVETIVPGGWQPSINNNLIKLENTSYLRGETWDNKVIIVDEMQNMNFQELDSIITRLGEDTRVIFCGDYRQTDLIKDHEIAGLHKFLRILNNLEMFSRVDFLPEDIVRSDLVRDYILAKERLAA